MQEKYSFRQKYWICQFTGWGFYAITWFIVGHGPEYFLGKVLYSFTIFALSLVSTHMYRAVILRYKWKELPIKKNILRVTISCIIIAIITETIQIVAFNWTNLNEVLNLPIGYIYVRYFNRSSVYLAWSIIYFAVHYFESYNNEKLEKLSYEMKLKDSALLLLKSQMHPHFIFNAINSISGLINENPQKAQVALSQLSSLLRYSLNANKNTTVPLEEEMQIVSDYLELESIRFEERLKVEIDIAPETLKIQVPPLMVQTLCENGIKHGISKLAQGGNLSIRSSIEENRLSLKVINTGKLIEENNSVVGYGISNTKQRLSLLYGNEASFRLIHSSEKLVAAELLIPFRNVYEHTHN